MLIIPAIVLSMLVVGVAVAIAAREIPRVRRWAVVTAIGVAAMPLAIVLHNVLSAFIAGDEAISFVLALNVAPLLILVGIIGAARVLLVERRELGIGVALAATGIAVFAVYMLFVLIVTTVLGRNPEWQQVTDAVAMIVAAAASVTGALLSLLAITRSRRALTA
jgi:hypothetical protein